MRLARRSELVAVASRTRARADAYAAEWADPARVRRLPGAAGRPGDRRRLHSAAQQRARAVDARGDRRRQARAVREAHGARRRPTSTAFTRPRRRRRWWSKRASCTAMSRSRPRCWNWCTAAPSARCAPSSRASPSRSTDDADPRLDPGARRRLAVGRRLLSGDLRAAAGRRAIPRWCSARRTGTPSGVDEEFMGMLRFPGGTTATIYSGLPRARCGRGSR